MDLNSAIGLYSQVVISAIPFALAMGIVEKVVDSLLRVIFGGRLSFD